MPFDVETAQNVEVSPKLPPEKAPLEQLEIMEAYTREHSAAKDLPPALREARCLNVLYPALFRSIQEGDLTAGRLDFLPIGFGCVTSVGGVGHYCVFAKLNMFRDQLPEAEKYRVDALYDYWLDNDVKTKYCREVVNDDTTGMFIDCDYPLIATARLSGMMLDYRTLLDAGIGGLTDRIKEKYADDPDNTFYAGALSALELFTECAEYLENMARQQSDTARGERRRELIRMADDLGRIKRDKPATFTEALQLFWLYALLAGVINYGRMDDVLGPFLKADLDAGRMTEEEAYRYILSLWRLIENRRTTVNGRIIVGGRGRRDPAAADIFMRLCLRAAKELRYVEPQFTLRFDRNTPEWAMDMAYDAIGAGATYPTLYNDDVNIPAVMRAMRVDERTAEQYVPFGCGEFVIQGQSVGTPNICLNLLKLLQIAVNGGRDPMDGSDRSGGAELAPAEELGSFEALFSQYRRLMDRYFDIALAAQLRSYEVMNGEVSYLFTSILMDDCIARGKALLDGGVRILGGTVETYGNINAADALYAIKERVYDERLFTLPELRNAANRNFKDAPRMRAALLASEKYGNDDAGADAMAVRLYNCVAGGIRDRGIAAGMGYVLIVISNNQLNTEWGRRTAASYDGRLSGAYMNPANNPQGGANKRGPTAMLNSLVKFDPGLHGGSVQNMKFTPALFNGERDKMKSMLATYFRRGGCQAMITVLDRGVLEDAVKRPELYRKLIVRVSGFSAVFVDLAPDIQQEIMSRVLYG